MFILSGIIIIIAMFFFTGNILVVIKAGATTLAILVPVVYSWFVWHREQKANKLKHP